MATTYRFVYSNRGDGQLWTPWLTTWNTRLGRSFDLSEATSLEIGVDVFNITNRGAAQQPLGSANQINSANYGGFQNIQEAVWSKGGEHTGLNHFPRHRNLAVRVLLYV